MRNLGNAARRLRNYPPTIPPSPLWGEGSGVRGLTCRRLHSRPSPRPSLRRGEGVFGRFLSLATVGVAALGLLAAGCGSGAGVKEKLGQIAHAPDPFFGGPTLGSGSRPPATSQDRIPPTETGGVTLLPPSTLAPGPASLAGRSSTRRENDLVIDTPPPGAPVKQANWSNRDGMTWEQAREMLRQRGVTSQRLEIHQGRWFLRCTMPHPTDPNRVREYQAVADDELSGMRAVIEQIDAGK